MFLPFSIYIFFGILPSLAWLFYYLRKDLHPESKKMIIKVFLWGSIATIPVIFIEKWLTSGLKALQLSNVFSSIIYWFLIIALTEEIFKYLAVRFFAQNSAEFDEPVDAMIYMVVSALGFAAVENIFYIISAAIHLSFNDAIFSSVSITIARFLGATFLHTLCSAIIGYFLAQSICYPKNRLRLLIIGFLVAVGLHGTFNFSIMNLEGNAKYFAMLAILIILTSIVMPSFEKLKKLKSICQYEKNKNLNNN